MYREGNQSISSLLPRLSSAICTLFTILHLKPGRFARIDSRSACIPLSLIPSYIEQIKFPACTVFWRLSGQSLPHSIWSIYLLCANLDIQSLELQYLFERALFLKLNFACFYHSRLSQIMMIVYVLSSRSARPQTWWTFSLSGPSVIRSPAGLAPLHVLRVCKSDCNSRDLQHELTGISATYVEDIMLTSTHDWIDEHQLGARMFDECC